MAPAALSSRPQGPPAAHMAAPARTAPPPDLTTSGPPAGHRGDGAMKAQNIAKTIALAHESRRRGREPGKHPGPWQGVPGGHAPAPLSGTSNASQAPGARQDSLQSRCWSWPTRAGRRAHAGAPTAGRRAAAARGQTRPAQPRAAGRARGRGASRVFKGIGVKLGAAAGGRLARQGGDGRQASPTRAWMHMHASHARCPALPAGRFPPGARPWRH